jgi:cytochrome c biogenesis protein CcmG, thiol:disulfide interchange protein DsbE
MSTKVTGFMINRLLQALLALLSAGLIFVIAYDLRDGMPKVGDRAPLFTVVTDQGRRITPTDFGGKILVVNFWASWCEPCVQETPSLNEFARTLKSKGVVVVGISQDQKLQSYRRFRNAFRIGFDTYRDTTTDIQTSFGTTRIPETYIIQNGRIVKKFISEQNWMSGEIIHYVQSLLGNV